MNHISKNRTGMVYLLHFDRPFRHARHYCGWTTDLAARLAEHACRPRRPPAACDDRRGHRLASGPDLARHPIPRTRLETPRRRVPSLPAVRRRTQTNTTHVRPWKESTAMTNHAINNDNNNYVDRETFAPFNRRAEARAVTTITAIVCALAFVCSIWPAFGRIVGTIFLIALSGVLLGCLIWLAFELKETRDDQIVMLVEVEPDPPPTELARPTPCLRRRSSHPTE
jgi:hypothetical protein